MKVFNKNLFIFMQFSSIKEMEK